ncbi:RNA polymerase sigma factor [Taibaiella sp. KBW10]|uniref:RNA polymerase sigma factor n=1 Tax=Taibaiella sp. KBW10 TaxID=2153357 RepID=UPI00131541EE|nr:RNA polymerase sigma factor [Taibaiella sp. KBW10]
MKKDRAFSGVEGLFLLIQQCIAKDKRAQKTLYDHFSPALYAKIRRYVYDVNHAGEILNESFFKILTHIEKYAHSGSFEGWMHRITINTTMDFLRKKIKQDQIVKTEVKGQEISIPETSIAKLAYNELITLVHGLPDMQRSVFNLFVFDDFSHKEIAGLLGITENNSRWHLNDARRRLKEKIDALT